MLFSWSCIRVSSQLGTFPIIYDNIWIEQTKCPSVSQFRTPLVHEPLVLYVTHNLEHSVNLLLRAPGHETL